MAIILYEKKTEHELQSSTVESPIGYSFSDLLCNLISGNFLILHDFQKGPGLN